MAGDGLFVVYHAIFPGLFYATAYHAMFIYGSISADTTIYDRRYIAIFVVYRICPCFFYFSNPFGAEIRFDLWIDLFEDLYFFLVQRCPAITCYTAGSFAGSQIADEFFFDDFVADVFIVNYDQ